MLVLSRKPGEKIIIGDVVITIVRIGPNIVRVGVEAPKDVVVLRAELANHKSEKTDGRDSQEIQVDGEVWDQGSGGSEGPRR